MPSAGASIGDWVVDGPLGAGGMGTVFRCHNRLAPRICAAVKVIHPDPAAEFRERFVHEVEALEGLQHPAIVRVKGWGATDDGRLWLAMDLVEGEDLAHRLARGPLDPDAARRLFRDLASGLAHAHEREVFHRDIKPANVLLTPDGNARIVDFGIAFQDGRTRVSTAGVIPGTPAYLAPEVFGGTPIPRALDVYAFGQVLAEALTGSPCFPEPAGMTTTAAIASVAGRKLSSGPIEVDAPDDLAEIVRVTTHPDPSQRLLDLTAVVRAFDGEPLPSVARPTTLEFSWDDPLPQASHPAVTPPDAPSAGPPPSSKPQPPVRKPPPPVPRRTSPWPMVAAVAFLAMGAVLALWALSGSAEPAERLLAVTGVPAELPSRLWIDGTPTPLVGGSTSLRSDEPVEAFVAAGLHCPLEDVAPPDCPPCCACAGKTLDSPLTTLPLSPPTDPTRLIVEVPDADDAVVRIDDQPTQRLSDGSHALQTAPGPHTVVVTRGTCPDEARGCGADCPTGCRSVVSEVEIACHEERRIPLTVPPPDAPKAPTSALAGKRVRVMYKRGERPNALAVAGIARRRGATVEVVPQLQADLRMFGRAIAFGSDDLPAARELSRAAVRHSRLDVEQAREPSDAIDLAIWVSAD